MQRPIDYLRLPLAAGGTARVRVVVPADLGSFTGPHLRRVVEPGELELRLGSSGPAIHLTATVTLTGPPRHVDRTRRPHARLDPSAAAPR